MEIGKENDDMCERLNLYGLSTKKKIRWIWFVFVYWMKGTCSLLYAIKDFLLIYAFKCEEIRYHTQTNKQTKPDRIRKKNKNKKKNFRETNAQFTMWKHVTNQRALDA